ncbi:MAG: helix-turn-helix domain-containing protein [Acidimicrobiales bacterium]
MTALPLDIQRIGWAAEQLGIGESTAYRLAETGQLPGAFKVGRQWRVSVPRFLREVHGEQVRHESREGQPGLPRR